MVKHHEKILIAIDGPAGAGKGTVAHFISQHIGLQHMDSGLLYRTFGRRCLDEKWDFKTADLNVLCANHVFDRLNDPRLKTEEIANMASQISIYPRVRTCINDYLREAFEDLDEDYLGLVVDGRDVGTVIFPEADIKLFITADPNVRAQRRQIEMKTEASLLEQLVVRDQRDSTRPIAPLEAAADAYILDTTGLSIDQTCEKTLLILKDLFLENV